MRPAIIRRFDAEENEERYELREPGGDLAGFACVITARPAPWIAEIWVEPVFRGRGYGTALLDAILTAHAGRGVALSAEPFEFTRPVSAAGLTAAGLAAWYSRHGFYPAGQRHAMRRDGQVS